MKNGHRLLCVHISWRRSPILCLNKLAKLKLRKNSYRRPFLQNATSMFKPKVALSCSRRPWFIPLQMAWAREQPHSYLHRCGWNIFCPFFASYSCNTHIWDVCIVEDLTHCIGLGILYAWIQAAHRITTGCPRSFIHLCNVLVPNSLVGSQEMFQL